MEDIEVFNLIESFADKYKKEKDKLPFSFNLLDEIRTDENGHTRIFMQLLNYGLSDKNTLVKKFLEKLDYFDISIVQKPNLKINKQYIDGLISEKGKYSIIIENKINGAVDQDKQIERYIEQELKISKVTTNNIYVIYITSDGNKEIKDQSLTDKAKKYLDYKSDNDTGRFIKMNYKDNILPWLKEEVLPNCKLKDDLFISAIKQYIDYLEGIFKLRQREASMEVKMTMEIEKLLKINDKSAKDKCEKIIKSLKNLKDLSDKLLSVKKDIIDVKNFAAVSENHLNKNIQDNNLFKHDYPNDTYLQFFKESWHNKKVFIHFEWCPFGEKNILNDNVWILGLHIERNNDLKKQFKDLHKNLQKATDDDNSNSVWSVKILKPQDKLFSGMSQSEIETFVVQAYKEAEKLIPIVDEFLKNK